MRVLVTGASGFVGRALSERLLSEGHEVVALVRSAKAELEELGARVVIGTLSDPKVIAEAAESCDIVVHAAAETSHRASPKALGWINVAGTENVLRAAQHAGVRRFIHLSCTDATLVRGPRVNWNEDRALLGLPLDAHARSKLAAEEIVLGSGGRGASRVDFETVVLRPALVWGSRDTSYLPRLCREALQGDGLSLFSSGENLVAVIHIDNLIEAIVRALSAEGAAGAMFHLVDRELTLASDFYRSLSEAVGLPRPRRSALGLRAELSLAWLRQRMGTEGPWPTDVVRRGQSASFDQQRALRVLGYEPVVSHEDGFAALAQWAKSVEGPERIASWARTPADDATVAAQVALAHET